MKHRKNPTLLNTVSAVTYDMSTQAWTVLQRTIVWLQNPISDAPAPVIDDRPLTAETDDDDKKAAS